MAIGIAGRLDFNPMTDCLDTPNGKMKFTPPSAPELPSSGFVESSHGFQSSAETGGFVKVDSNSDRLQELKPFEPWSGVYFENLVLLAKLKGKCTTDHISPAGYWLRFRGHLTKISNNFLLGAVNAFTSEVGKGRNPLSKEAHQHFAHIAFDLHSQTIPWFIVGDENYGEGSSREHAAMTPRYLGCKVVVARSFARIHLTNLKKQGVLALTFSDPKDYEKIQEGDRISLRKISHLRKGSKIKMIVKHSSGKEEEIELAHSYSEEQLQWFKAGSALNHVRQAHQKGVETSSTL